MTDHSYLHDVPDDQGEPTMPTTDRSEIVTSRETYAKLDANTSGPSHQGQTSAEARAALNEIDHLRRRDLAWAESTVWRANWMTRAVNLLGALRDDLEHELTESGHLAELEQLLADEFEDGDGDDD